jgi:hypothetical protein
MWAVASHVEVRHQETAVGQGRLTWALVIHLAADEEGFLDRRQMSNPSVKRRPVHGSAPKRAERHVR